MSSNKAPKIGGESFTGPKIGNPMQSIPDGGLTPEVQAYIDRRIFEHSHNGADASRTDLDAIQGLFETVSAAPTGIPSDVFDQIKIYSNGSTYRLYWYDTTGHAWRYATGT